MMEIPKVSMSDIEKNYPPFQTYVGPPENVQIWLNRQFDRGYTPFYVFTTEDAARIVVVMQHATNQIRQAVAWQPTLQGLMPPPPPGTVAGGTNLGDPRPPLKLVRPPTDEEQDEVPAGDPVPVTE